MKFSRQMQLANFKYYIRKVIRDGNSLQKKNVHGKVLTTRRFTETQGISILIGITALVLLPAGFSDNFAGYIISFLGIFIGLFTGIVVSMHDKSKALIQADPEDEFEKTRLISIKNYYIQFTGLTAYSILLGLVIIFLLSLVLLSKNFSLNIQSLSFIRSIKDLTASNVLLFLKALIIILHRFLVVYFLINFFTTTLYSIASFFNFLGSDYRKIKIKQRQ